MNEPRFYRVYPSKTEGLPWTVDCGSVDTARGVVQVHIETHSLTVSQSAFKDSQQLEPHAYLHCRGRLIMGENQHAYILAPDVLS